MNYCYRGCPCHKHQEIKRIKHRTPSQSTDMLRLAHFRVGLSEKAYQGGHLDTVLSSCSVPKVLSALIATYLSPYEQCYFSFHPSINVSKEASKHEDITNIFEFMEASLKDWNPHAASLFLPCMNLRMTGFGEFLHRMDALLRVYARVCSIHDSRELFVRLKKSDRFNSFTRNFLASLC